MMTAFSCIIILKNLDNGFKTLNSFNISIYFKISFKCTKTKMVLYPELLTFILLCRLSKRVKMYINFYRVHKRPLGEQSLLLYLYSGSSWSTEIIPQHCSVQTAIGQDKIC